MSFRNPKAQHLLVELKAKVDGLQNVRNKLIQCGAKRVGVFHQVDTYYRVPIGRLKLRKVEGKTEVQLIYYEREDVAMPKRSSVFIIAVPQPETFEEILNCIMEINVVVDKIREIYVYEGIQIHLDDVGRLGSFVEFELVTSRDVGQQKGDLLRLDAFRERLGISQQCLVNGSYSDLI
jgi:adenylate cyclase class 2